MKKASLLRNRRGPSGPSDPRPLRYEKKQQKGRDIDNVSPHSWAWHVGPLEVYTLACAAAYISQANSRATPLTPRRGTRDPSWATPLTPGRGTRDPLVQNISLRSCVNLSRINRACPPSLSGFALAEGVGWRWGAVEIASAET